MNKPLPTEHLRKWPGTWLGERRGLADLATALKAPGHRAELAQCDRRPEHRSHRQWTAVRLLGLLWRDGLWAQELSLPTPLAAIGA